MRAHVLGQRADRDAIHAVLGDRAQSAARSTPPDTSSGMRRCARGDAHRLAPCRRSESRRSGSACSRSRSASSQFIQRLDFDDQRQRRMRARAPPRPRRRSSPRRGYGFPSASPRRTGRCGGCRRRRRAPRISAPGAGREWSCAYRGCARRCRAPRRRKLAVVVAVPLSVCRKFSALRSALTSARERPAKRATTVPRVRRARPRPRATRCARRDRARDEQASNQGRPHDDRVFLAQQVGGVGVVGQQRGGDVAAAEVLGQRAGDIRRRCVAGVGWRVRASLCSAVTLSAGKPAICAGGDGFLDQQHRDAVVDRGRRVLRSRVTSAFAHRLRLRAAVGALRCRRRRWRVQRVQPARFQQRQRLARGGAARGCRAACGPWAIARVSGGMASVEYALCDMGRPWTCHEHHALRHRWSAS